MKAMATSKAMGTGRKVPCPGDQNDAYDRDLDGTARHEVS